ncbi:nickel-binding protein [Carboxylicivirga sp. RSCT41]|uniref:nickel-binding protein n=1 Tax=Carboxylicivirga agarovorans TaxID=3417570 RepID=UPI003D3470EB
MPLYMDCHHLPGIRLEDAKVAHIRDVAVQAKYGVKYHQFWVNEEKEMAFCLVEGPSKEACQATHMEANFMTACNIVEVDGGLYSAFMAYGQAIDHGVVMEKDDLPDSGFRFILTLDIIALTQVTNSVDFEQLKFPEAPRNIAHEYISKHQGRLLKQLQKESIIATFMTPEGALRCALAIKDDYDRRYADSAESPWNIRYKMGISVGQPVTEHEDRLFEKAIRDSSRLCKVAANGHIKVSSEIGKLSFLCEDEIIAHKLSVLDITEQQFFNQLFDLVEARFADDDFTVDNLSREIGLSRSQLYRKTLSLTGNSPVEFIRDIKLQKAFYLIRQTPKNISEIALEVGINNPSYFSKCFQKKYGIAPSQLAV